MVTLCPKFRKAAYPNIMHVTRSSIRHLVPIMAVETEWEITYDVIQRLEHTFTIVTFCRYCSMNKGSQDFSENQFA